MAMLKEETTLEETTAEITVSVTEAETTVEIQEETTTEPTEMTKPSTTLTEPAEENGCGGFSVYAMFALIPICFVILKKKE